MFECAQVQIIFDSYSGGEEFQWMMTTIYVCSSHKAILYGFRRLGIYYHEIDILQFCPLQLN